MGIHSKYNTLTLQELEIKYPDKRCKLCKQRKNRLEFNSSVSCQDGLGSYCRKCASIKILERRENNLAQYILGQVRCRARTQNIPFNLELSDIQIPTHCPILGIKLQLNKGVKDNSYSIDKIIPELGYVKGNIIIISMRANRIKSDASIEELLKISKFYKKLLGKLK